MPAAAAVPIFAHCADGHATVTAAPYPFAGTRAAFRCKAASHAVEWGAFDEKPGRRRLRRSLCGAFVYAGPGRGRDHRSRFHLRLPRHVALVAGLYARAVRERV